MIKLTKKDLSDKEGLARSMAKVLDIKLAEDIRIINVSELTSLCDYFVICSARSDTHIEALCNDLEEALSKHGIAPLRKEGKKESGWMVLDYASSIVHIFNRSSRDFYGIEKLWKDGIFIQ